MLHEMNMKVVCSKCKKVMDSPKTSNQIAQQGVKDTTIPNLCDQCSGEPQASTLPPALGNFAQGAVGPNASAKKLEPEAPINLANKYRRPPPLANNAQPI